MKPTSSLTALALLFSTFALPLHAERILLVAGGDQEATEIPAQEAKLYEPFGAEYSQDGSLWIIEMAAGNRLLKVDRQGTLRHVTGQRKSGFAGDGEAFDKVQFSGPHNLALGDPTTVYIADTWNGRIRKVDLATNTTTTLPGFEVPLDKGKQAGPYCITLDFAGKFLYVADLRQIWQVEIATGKSVIVAGNGKKGIPTDGAKAIQSPLVDPRAAAIDRIGNLYILERGGNALRVVSPEGLIRTVVNRSGKQGNSGDGGHAIDAMLNGPKHLCIDKDNQVIIADAENHIIRRFNPRDEKIYRVAGTGKMGSQGLGDSPDKCQLARPHGVSIHPQTGELIITDSYNNRVLKIVKD
jgi:DNA-binding beta-propeller fold protein YncE